ncbi:DUF3299 domain-containing protein [Thalassotalea nanhaiensis]|uniref:DUF3299 domain-containing protein n=1 Tax=Thalassotalea nanhaiensis TaxID=3065648 RepID=A0ABY9TET5_9GAMM|nr:DUF3299 domain-containing protein [Colwelliaceae bacterium SQ345]
MLKKIILLAALVNIIATANVIAATEKHTKNSVENSGSNKVNWNWEKILPEQKQVNNPFAKLTKTQLDDLGYYVGMKQDIEAVEKQSPKYEKLPLRKTELEKLGKYLTAQGIDIDYLLSQRDRVIEARTHNAINVNSSIINQLGTISGYVIPIKRENNKLVEFFLIEENPFGHAGHDHSSPNPNQVIYVNFKSGINVMFKELMTLTGVLTKQTYSAEVTMVDGHTTDMEASYQLELTSYQQN